MIDADWLLQRGSPSGEFIALQLADVSTHTSSETPIVVASRLEAIRVQVLPPTDDIAIASATTDLPVARVVDRH